MAGERPRVRFFDGKEKEGIRAIQEDILKSGVKSKEEIVPLDEYLKLFSMDERKWYIAKRKKEN